MQLTFFFIYLIFYIMTLLCFWFYMLIYFNTFFNFNMSISRLVRRLRTYTHQSSLLIILFFLASGIPPVGLFFLKLNFLAYLMVYSNLSILFLVFILFFFNMLFYVYVFKFRVKTSVENLGFGSVKLISGRISPLSVVGLFKERSSSSSVYTTYFLLIFVTLFMWLNLFFFSDIFFIFCNCIL